MTNRRLQLSVRGKILSYIGLCEAVGCLHRHTLITWPLENIIRTQAEILPCTRSSWHILFHAVLISFWISSTVTVAYSWSLTYPCWEHCTAVSRRWNFGISNCLKKTAKLTAVWVRRQTWAALPKHLETSATVSSCRLCSLQSLAASRLFFSSYNKRAPLSLYRPKLGVALRDSLHRTTALTAWLCDVPSPSDSAGREDLSGHHVIELYQVVSRQADQFVHIGAQFGCSYRSDAIASRDRRRHDGGPLFVNTELVNTHCEAY